MATSLLSSCIGQKVEKKKFAFEDKTDINQELIQKIKSEDYKKQASILYKKNCQACHGVNGRGRVGPNLVDDHWIYGQGTVENIYKIIKEGIVKRGMTSFENKLTQKEIMSLSLFLYSLRGSNPQGAKAPQGKKITL